MMHYHNVRVIMVFDGANLPAKEVTEIPRAEGRARNLAMAERLNAEGKKKDAYQYYAQAVDVSPLMASQLIRFLKNKYGEDRVDCIVAPYEADAQLAYLSATGKCDAVVGEDSDTIPFGVSQCIFKLNAKNGDCQHFVLQDLFGSSSNGGIGTGNGAGSTIDFSKFTQDMLLVMCIASGCDYLPNVKNFGIRKAYDLVKKQKGDVNKVLKVMRLEGLIPLKFVDSSVFLSGPLSEGEGNKNNSSTGSIGGAGNATVTSKRTNVLEYELGFAKALATFKYQVIYDSDRQQMRYMNELPMRHLDQLPKLLQALLSPAIYPLTLPDNTNGSSSSSSSSSSELTEGDPSPERTAGLAQALAFLGVPEENHDIARGIARGELDPTTKEAFPAPLPVPERGESAAKKRGENRGVQAKAASIQSFFGTVSRTETANGSATAISTTTTTTTTINAATDASNRGTTFSAISRQQFANPLHSYSRAHSTTDAEPLSHAHAGAATRTQGGGVKEKAKKSRPSSSLFFTQQPIVPSKAELSPNTSLRKLHEENRERARRSLQSYNYSLEQDQEMDPDRVQEQEQGRPGIKVIATSHIGGHKHAGTLIVYPAADWYVCVCVCVCMCVCFCVFLCV